MRKLGKSDALTPLGRWGPDESDAFQGAGNMSKQGAFSGCQHAFPVTRSWIVRVTKDGTDGMGATFSFTHEEQGQNEGQANDAFPSLSLSHAFCLSCSVNPGSRMDK